jgi:hypothetical protein
MDALTQFAGLAGQSAPIFIFIHPAFFPFMYCLYLNSYNYYILHSTLLNNIK